MSAIDIKSDGDSRAENTFEGCSVKYPITEAARGGRNGYAPENLI